MLYSVGGGGGGGGERREKINYVRKVALLGGKRREKKYPAKQLPLWNFSGTFRKAFWVLPN